jgi:excinuclease UvrABC ATPase subunit
MCDICEGVGVIHVPHETYGIEFIPCQNCKDERQQKRAEWEKRIDDMAAEMESPA